MNLGYWRRGTRRYVAERHQIDAAPALRGWWPIARGTRACLAPCQRLFNLQAIDSLSDQINAVDFGVIISEASRNPIAYLSPVIRGPRNLHQLSGQGDAERFKALDFNELLADD